MTGAEFRDAWQRTGDQLLQYPASLLGQSDIPDDSKRFLETIGLPGSAAPFLSFGPDYISLPVSVAAAPLSHLEIGANGSGDPVTVLKDGSVAYFNHDGGFSHHYINKSLPALAQSLILFRDLGSVIMRINGEDAFIDGNWPQHLVQNFILALERIDPRSIEPQSFWAQAIEHGR